MAASLSPRCSLFKGGEDKERKHTSSRPFANNLVGQLRWWAATKPYSLEVGFVQCTVRQQQQRPPCLVAVAEKMASLQQPKRSCDSLFLSSYRGLCKSGTGCVPNTTSFMRRHEVGVNPAAAGPTPQRMTTPNKERVAFLPLSRALRLAAALTAARCWAPSTTMPST